MNYSKKIRLILFSLLFLSCFTENNTINIKGKNKLVRNKKSFKSGYKKAVVTLKKGQSIDLATGLLSYAIEIF